MRVLICESDPQTFEIASGCLKGAGFQVIECREPASLLESGPNQIDIALVNLAVVDLGFGEGRGQAICRRLHEMRTPVLALTELSEAGDAEDGREFGADDYQIKPANPRELVARVRVLARRDGNRERSGQLLHIRDLTIDQERLQVIRNGRPIGLTPTQFRLLSCLVRNAGKVMTSRDLLREAQGYDIDEQDAQEIVKVHVNHLRQKIEPDSSNPSYILNVRGFGYMLDRRTPPNEEPVNRSFT